MAVNEIAQRIQTYIKARYPILWIRSWEEARVERALIEIAESVAMEHKFWSITHGFQSLKAVQTNAGTELRWVDEQDQSLRVPDDALAAVGKQKVRALVVMRDLHRHFDNHLLVRRLRDLAKELRTTQGAEARTLVLLSPVIEMPVELQKDIAVLDWPLPGRAEIEATLQDCLEMLDRVAEEKKKLGVKADEIVDSKRALGKVARAELVESALGLTLEEAKDVFSRSLVGLKRLDVGLIASEKEQVIAKSGVLEWVKVERAMADQVGGLDRFKRFATQLRRAFTPEAVQFSNGMTLPRGILVAGPPGCGKTTLAKMLAATWQMPLLASDVGAWRGKYVGESEENQRRAWDTAQAIAPVVWLWDEMEKMFASGSEDDVGKRMLATTLRRMQERPKDQPPVFIVGTCNALDELPSPLLRPGRFDGLWWVGFPHKVEREQIFAIHLKRSGREPKKYPIEQLAAKSDGYSGAEIENAVVTGLRAAFSESRELSGEDMVAALAEMVPLSKTRGDVLKAVEEKYKGQLRYASDVEAGSPARRGRAIEI